MGGKGNTVKNASLNQWLGNVSPTIPATYYVALYTVAPSSSGGGTEASGGGYARLAVTNNTANFPVTSTGVKTNGVDWDFGTFSGSVGTVVAAALMDASSGGNLHYWGPFTVPQTIDSGNTFKIVAGQATFTES